MEAFEIIAKNTPYKVTRDVNDCELFHVFNHAVYYTIKKDNCGIWVKVDHRFGSDEFPVNEAGDEIEQFYNYLAFGAVLKQP